MRLWSFHWGSDSVREDQHFSRLTHLITIWEYVLYLLLETQYGFPQFHVAIIFCFFNLLMTVDQLVLFKNGLKCFYLAFVLCIYFDCFCEMKGLWVTQFLLFRLSVSGRQYPACSCTIPKRKLTHLMVLRSICFEIPVKKSSFQEFWI